LGVVAVSLLMAVALAGGHRLIERWKDTGRETRRFGKLLVVAITDDHEARRNFENKFVSHLRGIGVDGVTSHSLVAELHTVEHEQAMLRILEDLKIDGAISVRAVPLKDLNEVEWGTAWREEVRAGGDLRTLIDETLPLAEQKAKRYGVEVALWDASSRDCIWAARTDSYKRKEMRDGAGEFVQFVMRALRMAELL
jgi:hypothetical protein